MRINANHVPKVLVTIATILLMAYRVSVAIKIIGGYPTSLVFALSERTKI